MTKALVVLSVFLSSWSSYSFQNDVSPEVKKALAWEKSCHLKFSNKAKAQCLSEVAEWWWADSVNYDLGPYDPIEEIHRILGKAKDFDPSNLEIFTNYLWMAFSVDVNRIQDGKATDLTDRAIQAIEAARNKNNHEKSFAFFFVIVDQVFLFTNPKSVGSKEMKLKYLAYAEMLQKKSRSLYPIAKSKMSSEQQKQVEAQMDVMDRVLAKRKVQLEG